MAKAKTPTKTLDPGNTGFRNRIVGHDVVPARSLVPNPMNWRQHTLNQREVLTGVLNEIGWIGEVIVNRVTGHLIDGHERTAIEAGRDGNVPVGYVELSEEEEALALATFNPIAAMATSDEQALNALIENIDTKAGPLATFLDGLYMEAQQVTLKKPGSREEGDGDGGDGEERSRERPQLKMLLYVDDANKLEHAIFLTGKAKRSEAMAEIAEVYLNAVKRNKA